MKTKPGSLFMILAMAVAIAVLSFLFASFVLAKTQIPKKPVENVYIFDYANLIDSSDEEEMRTLAKEIEDKSKAEIVVVTVETLGSYTIEEYANELFNSWGIGDKEINNGVLILVNKENLLSGKRGRIRIEVGYGLEGTIPDGKAGRILDEYAIPAFENKEYSKGIKDTFLAVASEVANEYGLKVNRLSGHSTSEDFTQNDSSSTTVHVGDEDKDISGLGIFVVVFLIIIFSLINRRRRRTYWWGQDPWDKDHHHFGGFGGFGGGGGSSGGGGFGGFGGGSSGGGGASR